MLLLLLDTVLNQTINLCILTQSKQFTIYLYISINKILIMQDCFNCFCCLQNSSHRHCHYYFTSFFSFLFHFIELWTFGHHLLLTSEWCDKLNVCVDCPVITLLLYCNYLIAISILNLR